MTPTVKRIFIAGAGTFAYWNAGDEAIFYTMVEELRAQFPDAEIGLLSTNPKDFLGKYQVEEIDLYEIREIIEYAQNSDLMILGGGGLFYDYWGFNVDQILTENYSGNGVYVSFALLANLLNKPLMMYAVGVGPLDSEKARRYTRLAFDQASIISVRDEPSKDLLESIGVHEDKIFVTADPVWQFPEVSLEESIEGIGELELKLDHPVLGVSLRPWDLSIENWEEEIAKALDSFVNLTNGTIIFIPFHKSINDIDDYAVSLEVQKKMQSSASSHIFNANLDLKNKVNILKSCDLFLGMRLHANIFAMRFAIPTIGLAYDPKVTNLFREVGKLEYVLPLEEIDENSLYIKLKQLFQNHSELEKEYKEISTSMFSKADFNSSLISKLNFQEKPDRIRYPDNTHEWLKNLILQSSLREFDNNKKLEQQISETSMLSEQVEELSKQTIELSRQAEEKNSQLNKIYASKSWRITKPLRVTLNILKSLPNIWARIKTILKIPLRIFEGSRNNPDRFKFLFHTFIKTVKLDGFRLAFLKTWKYLKTEIKKTDHTVQDQEIYLLQQKTQSEHLANYNGSNEAEADIEILKSFINSHNIQTEKILIYPLSYPRELKQRPDHILKVFSENEYKCIIVSIDDKPKFIKEEESNVIVTNMFWATFSYFMNKNVIFYITYPFFSHIIRNYRNSYVIYDVLDDLTVFSWYCDAMEQDHKYLIDRANMVIFSSQELREENDSNLAGKESFLIRNGVWADDFKINPKDYGKIINFKKNSDEFILGYHGVVSELLDWPLLENLIKSTNNLRLVFIGPIATFNKPDGNDENMAAQKRVLDSPKVSYFEAVPYSNLKYYLGGFDAAIIPFVVNEKTNTVLPLKLLEYMAVGIPIFGTNTKTLKRYSQNIIVGNSNEIIQELIKIIENGNSESVDYSMILNNFDWGKQIEPLIPILEKDRATTNNIRTKTVDIVNVNFYDWDGITRYKGGAERYVFDLACIFKEEGWQPRILQNANRPFEKVFQDIPVVGVPSSNGYDMQIVSNAFREVCKNTDLVIASPVDLACELRNISNVIGINHGIYWDSKQNEIKLHTIKRYENIFKGVRNSTEVIAVDTNFINWMRTYDYQLAEKLTYIPNYFDSEVFFPTAKNFTDKIRILYPRRLYEARGIFLTLKAFSYLFEHHTDIELHLVGQASKKDAPIIEEFIEKFETRVIWEEYEMDDMYKVYQSSHIVLIPTMYAEGTSLSCIEAMATNNAIIATNIGGLPNLVVNGYNGLLINPELQELINSIQYLIGNRDLIKRMASNGIELSKTFEKSHWENKWRKIIRNIN